MYLSPKKQEFVNFILGFTHTNERPPTFVEIMKGLNISSLGTIHWYVTELEKEGVIKRTRGHQGKRALSILEQNLRWDFFKTPMGLVYLIINEYFDDIESRFKLKVKEWEDGGGDYTEEKTEYDMMLLFKNWYKASGGSAEFAKIPQNLRPRMKRFVKQKLVLEKRNYTKLKKDNKDISNHIYTTLVLLESVLDNDTRESDFKNFL